MKDNKSKTYSSSLEIFNKINNKEKEEVFNFEVNISNKVIIAVPNSNSKYFLKTIYCNDKNEKLNKKNLIYLSIKPHIETHDKVIQFLLNPKDWIYRYSYDNSFKIDKNIVYELIDKAYTIIKNQPISLKLYFGNLKFN